MTKFVNWCSSHKLANILLILVYYILVVAPHKLFGTFLLVTVLPGMADSITARNEYNLIIIIIAVLVLLSYCLIFAYYVNKSSEKKKLWGYMIVNIALASIVINILFVINTEVIHFPQYALFAILLFPLVGNYTATLVWATLGGMLDEAYQYFYLAPLDTSFYDLNDVVTNIIGAVFGLLLLRSLSVKEFSWFNLKKSSIWIGIGFVFITIIIAHLSGILSIYPSDDRPYHILREWPPGFWSKVYPQITYHVIRPVEGLVIILLLWVFYSRIGPKTAIDG